MNVANTASSVPTRPHFIRLLCNWTIAWADRPGSGWALPVLAHGKVYGRNAKGDLICLDGGGRSNSAFLP